MLRTTFVGLMTMISFCLAGLALANGTLKKAPTCPAAFKPGFLIGLQVGNGNTHTKTIVPSGLGTYQNTAGGRVYVGYQFSQYLGVQMGFTYITTTKVGGTKINNSWMTDLVGVLSVGGIGTQGIAGSGFGAYAKAGVGYAKEELDKSTIITPSGVVPYSSRFTAWNLVYGAGITYTLPTKERNIALDVSYESHLGRPRAPITNFMPAMDLYSFGVEYLFNLA